MIQHKAQRVYTIILEKGQRGKRHLADFSEWQSTGIPNTLYCHNNGNHRPNTVRHR